MFLLELSADDTQIEYQSGRVLIEWSPLHSDLTLELNNYVKK